MENFSVEKQCVVKVSSDTYIVVFKENISHEFGQFVMIQTTSLTRKPFMLGTWENKTAISVQVKGHGTRNIVTCENKLQLHGPLGKAISIPSGKGIAVVSISCLAAAIELHNATNCDVLIGSKRPICFNLPFRQCVKDSEFSKALKSTDFSLYDWYFISGSRSMENLVLETIPNKKNAFVSMEEYMACGIGACKGCAIQTKAGIKHVCTDGPVFRGDMLC